MSLRSKPFLLSRLATLFLCTFIITPVAFGAPDAENFWPEWRGPLHTGEAPLADPPLQWNETNHIKWRATPPGSGTSTPIIWADRLFLLTAIPVEGSETSATSESKETSSESPRENRRGRPGARSDIPQKVFKFAVLCYDRSSGKLLWQKVVREEKPHEGHHDNHGFASASPVTDGERLYAFFGSRGLHCLDFKGNLLWSKNFGQMHTKNSFGEAASPALAGDRVIINWDHEGEDFITALNKKTGAEIWRVTRDEGTGWATPLIVPFGTTTQIVVNATGKVRSYDLADGKELWSCGGQTVNAIPTPVADAATVFVTSGFRGSALMAITLGKTGNLEGSDSIRWQHNKNTPYVPSPLLTGTLLYVINNNNGVLSCFDTKNGNALYEAERIEGVRNVYASPVAAKERIYVLSREGTCVVLKAGPKLEILATNQLDDATDASIAMCGKDLFVRGHKTLYCISEK